MNLLNALQFLTILPIRSGSAHSGRCAIWFPLVGALLGLLAATVCFVIPAQGPLLALLLLVMVTGGLHEDGLADVCDALRAYRSREKMLAILHDSRVGAHGVIGLIFSVFIRWQALAHMEGNIWVRLPVAVALSRGAMVLMAASLPAAGAGLGQQFKSSLSRTAAVITAVQMLLLCGCLGWPVGGIVLAAQTATLALTGLWFRARLGGVTGDCLGFTCQVSEAVSMVALSAL